MTNRWSFTPRRKPRESAAQMLARKQNGETLTDEEDVLCENLWQHQGYKKIEADEADRSFQNDFRDALQEIGISSDRTMHISISSAGEVRVTGLSDEEYRLAGYVEELDRFLNKVSNGNVTVDDL